MEDRVSAIETKTEMRPARASRCSFCQGDVADDRALTIRAGGAHGGGHETSCFCSTRCRNCVLALAALHPSPLSGDDFIERRVLTAERLLALWRHGRGPDPALVLAAARRAGHQPKRADPAFDARQRTHDA